MYLYIALILSLATATGFALLAAKRGRDYNRLQKRYRNSFDICTMWRRTALKLARDVAEANRKITEREQGAEGMRLKKARMRNE